MKKRIVPLLLLASVLLNLVLLNQMFKPEQGEVVTDTTTVVSTFVPDSAADSSFVECRDYKIPASAIKVRGNGTKSVNSGTKSVNSGTETAENGNLQSDSVNSMTDSLTIQMNGDSVTVTLPITQKVYSDSTYTAYVSGFDAKLDSISVYSKMITVTRREPTPAFTLGVQAGYGITPAGMQPYIGLGVQYNFSLSKIWPFRK